MTDRPEFPFVYIILDFPKRSEQFITREVTALGRRFGKVLVYALRKGDYDLSLNNNITVVYLDERPWRQVLCAHLYLMRRRPAAYRHTLWKRIIFPFLKAIAPLSPAERRRRAGKKLRRYTKSAVIAADLLKWNTAHIHAHYAHRPAEMALRVSGFTGIPFSFTAHAKDLFLTRRSKVARLVKRASFTLTCTKDGEKYLKSIVPERYQRRIYCLYHGLPLERFCAGGADKPAGSRPVILSAGRFIDKKGFDILLSALAEIKKRGIGFRCILAGDGPLADEIKNKAAVLELTREVEFPGFISEWTLMQLYDQADVFALACRESADGNKDGIPNVILEAMAFGLPVVSTRIGGIPEVVRSGENGCLLEPEKPQVMADALEYLLLNKNIRNGMGRRGRKLVANNFDIFKNSEKLFRLFLRRSVLLRTFIAEPAEGCEEKLDDVKVEA